MVVRLGDWRFSSHGLTEDGKTIGIYATPILDKAAYWYLFFRPKRPDCADIADQWTSPIKQSITA